MGEALGGARAMILPDALLHKLKGPRPPAHFQSDGCTGIVDWWVRVACVWHDHAYHCIRNQDLGTKERALHRQIADKDFRYNIRVMSRWKEVNGVIVKRRLFSRRIPGSVLAVAYWVGVRLFGGRFVR